MIVMHIENAIFKGGTILRLGHIYIIGHSNTQYLSVMFLL